MIRGINSSLRQHHTQQLQNTCSFQVHAHQDESMAGFKINLNQFKRTEIMQTMFSDHKGIKLEINNRKITEKLKTFET